MKHLLLPIFIGTVFSVQAAENETWVCEQNGQTVYSTTKIHAKCQPRPTPTAASEPLAVSKTMSIPQIIDNEIAQTWGKLDSQTFNETNDIVLLPEIASEPQTNISGSLKPQKETNIHLRNAPTIADGKILTKQDLVRLVKVPPKPPVLTRRQILQQEIDREQAALRTLTQRLAAASQSKNTALIQKLNAQISDRQQNLHALNAEMRR